MRYWIDFKKLREELSFEKVLEHYKAKFHRKGEQATGTCPLPGHTGARKTDSFSASLTKGIFQCFSCQAKGNVLDFAVLMEGRNPELGDDLRQTAIELAKRFSLQHVGSEQKSNAHRANGSSNARRPTERPEKPAPATKQGDSKPPIINAPLGFTLQDLDGKHPYLLERGFSEQTIRDFGLGFCKKGRLTGRVAIPIHDKAGVLIAYAGRLVDDSQVSSKNPKYLFPGNREYQNQIYDFKKSLVLYNAHRLKAPLQNLIIVEGFASVWWLTQCGFPHCAALMGSSMSTEQTDIIRTILGAKGIVTVLTDGDVPGMRCCDEIRATLGTTVAIHRPSLPIDAQPTDFTSEELKLLLKLPENISEKIALRQLTKEERICGLIREFSSLVQFAPNPHDWNAEAFDKQSLVFSSGERAAAQFVLTVWNPQTKWQSGRFDLVNAASHLDESHRHVINNWIKRPWWP